MNQNSDIKSAGKNFSVREVLNGARTGKKITNRNHSLVASLMAFRFSAGVSGVISQPAESM